MGRNTTVCLDFLKHIIIKYKTMKKQQEQGGLLYHPVTIPNTPLLSLTEVKLAHAGSSKNPLSFMSFHPETRNPTSRKVLFLKLRFLPESWTQAFP